MQIEPHTRVSRILEEYGDIAEVMEALGVKRIGTWSVRRLVARFITVRTAAFVHRVPLDEFLRRLRLAVSTIEARKASARR